MEQPKPEEVKPIEVERKWTINEVPANLESYPHAEIAQGYLAITADKTEVRLRDKDGANFTQTVKIGQGLVRGEYEVAITPDQFAALWPATAGKRVEKTRYAIDHNGAKIELDVYKGPLAGLVTAEVEFKSPDDSTRFQAPTWFGSEVTTAPEYKNQSLALKGRPAPAAPLSQGVK